MEQKITQKSIATQMKNLSSNLENIFNTLYEKFGVQHWWPGDTREEIIIGAILTQNTNWGNVEKAIANLREAGLLNLHKIAHMKETQLARLIKPAGYFNIKARRLRSTALFFDQRQDLLKENPGVDRVRTLRDELLSIHGVGKETADSILLYALDLPVFVVDAYTRRIFYRHGIIAQEKIPYDNLQEIIERNLPADVALYNEYHALLVRLGKTFCRSTPLCQHCPLFKPVFFTEDKKLFMRGAVDASQ